MAIEQQQQQQLQLRQQAQKDIRRRRFDVHDSKWLLLKGGNSGILKEEEAHYTAESAVEGATPQVTERMDHDRLYKELLQTFFAEFVELFFPEAHAAIDFEQVQFLSQDVFTDVTRGERRSIDVLAQTTLKGELTTIIVHVEHQSYSQPDFNERMFIYFSRLLEKHRCRVLPIAVFSHDAVRVEPERYQVQFSFLDVLDFKYYTVQLHKQDWRAYIRKDNPVAAALLAQMGYTPQERVQVKVEFLRMLVRLGLDPARTQLLIGFFEQYVKLSEGEEKALRKQVEQLEPQEVEAIFRIETSWERRGRMLGREEGRQEGLKEGLDMGTRKGRMEAQREFALRLLAQGTAMSVAEIARLTDLEPEEVERLQAQQNS